MISSTKTILFLCFASLATLALAQLKPGTPVSNFKLPLFNEAGYREWYLRGEKGIYESETQVRIENMTVSQYTGDDEGREISVFTSPEAVFHYDSTTAFGPSNLFIETETFKVTGQDWIWLGKQKEISINRNVRVIIYQEFGKVL